VNKYPLIIVALMVWFWLAGVFSEPKPRELLFLGALLVWPVLNAFNLKVRPCPSCGQWWRVSASQLDWPSRGREGNRRLCQTCFSRAEEREAAAQAAAEQTRQQELARVAAEKKRLGELKRGFARDARTVGFLQTLDPYTFQRLTWKVFERLGYEVEETPVGRDGGADGILHRAGTRCVLQCKRYRGDVGEPVLRDLFGTVHHLGAQSGVLVTTGNISVPARLFAEGKPLSLVDGKELLRLIESVNLTEETVPDDFVAPREWPSVIDPRAGRNPKCPDCSARLKLRTGRFGEFWACTRRACQFTIKAKSAV